VFVLFNVKTTQTVLSKLLTGGSGIKVPWDNMETTSRTKKWVSYLLLYFIN